ncbi:hypothetical protein V6N12_036166 [Hibiscus sabdariffa]|uniref:Uncharacterized protein n=1 Tax=Hibiscus sabdariffa TaxID=183260 RepID=A0ABR2EQB0_9ROSI
MLHYYLLVIIRTSQPEWRVVGTLVKNFPPALICLFQYRLSFDVRVRHGHQIRVPGVKTSKTPLFDCPSDSCRSFDGASPYNTDSGQFQSSLTVLFSPFITDLVRETVVTVHLLSSACPDPLSLVNRLSPVLVQQLSFITDLVRETVVTVHLLSPACPDPLSLMNRLSPVLVRQLSVIQMPDRSSRPL